MISNAFAIAIAVVISVVSDVAAFVVVVDIAHAKPSSSLPRLGLEADDRAEEAHAAAGQLSAASG